jgi:hypothetical protein
MMTKPHTHVERGKMVLKERDVGRRRELCEWEG